MSEEETPLGGGASGLGIVRVGDTVRRPSRFVTTTMRDVLQHLERVGFDAAPRWLGVDEQGRDILTWIEGDTFVDRGRMHPYIGEPPGRIAFDDEQLTAVFRLLRRYHDTFGGDVICHGDYGPWNLVWRDELPVAIIDFDSAYPGDPADDVGYALRMFVSYGFGPWTPDESVRRTRVALAAYGRDFDVPALLAAEYDRAEAKGRANGWHRQLKKIPVERAWLEMNAGQFAL
jgi:aminoglycoside phosphotransferase (APT) family kinase protein